VAQRAARPPCPRQSRAVGLAPRRWAARRGRAWVGRFLSSRCCFEVLFLRVFFLGFFFEVLLLGRGVLVVIAPGWGGDEGGCEGANDGVRPALARRLGPTPPAHAAPAATATIAAAHSRAGVDERGSGVSIIIVL
jgi:hypothetical protein